MKLPENRFPPLANRNKCEVCGKEPEECRCLAFCPSCGACENDLETDKCEFCRKETEA